MEITMAMRETIKNRYWLVMKKIKKFFEGAADLVVLVAGVASS